MNEDLLHYIWKYQKFNPSELSLIDKRKLHVFHPGHHNQDSGPDFEEARLKIANIEWAGQVEIHINTSDWLHHGHQHDPAYGNIILHVVWNHDKEITNNNNEVLPTLELKKLIDPTLLEKYQQHLSIKDEILCSSHLKTISSITVNGMMDRTLVERLNEKSVVILAQLAENKHDWEAVTYQTLAKNFGFSVNKEAFEQLSKILPFSVLKKVLHSEKQTEALVFGQAGFLNDQKDDHQQTLWKEYYFLHQKFQLPEPLSKAQWKFGRMRPPNFPTVRLAQFAALLHHQPKLFTLLTQTESIKKLKKELEVSTSNYWQSHYDFGKEASKPIAMGNTSFENILINTVVPLLSAYAKHTDNQQYMDRSISLLESLSFEKNRITKKWQEKGVSKSKAFDSQALLQLFNKYCQHRKCLNCNIGTAIISS